MSTGIAGSYDGEGPNVGGGLAPATPSPDAGLTGPNPTTTGQGKMVMAAMDRRRRVRVSSEGARTATAISVGGGDQVLKTYARGVYVATGGTLVCRLADDTADATFTGLLGGAWYPFCVSIVRASGTTAVGVLLF